MQLSKKINRMKYVSALVQVFLFGAAIVFSFYSLQPNINATTNNTSFSVENALLHVNEMAKEPHFTGSDAHAKVRNYLVSELENLGLQPHLQQGFSTTYFYGLSIAIPENILAKIEGKNPEEPALVIMSHYDSVSHSALGAADAASGVAAILESIRAFQAKGEQPHQDIIILFTDAEEVGLNGASLFVKEHPWAENLGLVLNFEARGSAGPSSMILEVNGGNKKLIEHFSKSNTANPFANSLLYSVYKLLPNDTDSTVFREQADIPSYFFAFIDDHFNYHTALDSPENLDIKSVNQQGEYALSLLNYFSNTSLSDLASESDHVYFNFPGIGMAYFSLNIALLLIVFGFLGLLVLTYIGIKRDKIRWKAIGKSIFYTIVSLIFAFLMGFYGWKLISNFYPEYSLILQGFPYNGMTYVIAFVCLTSAVYFRFFHYFSSHLNLISFFPFPIFLWLLISFLAYLLLPGASYFVIPALCGLLIFACLVLLKINNQSLFFLLSLPILFLLVPFIYFFPVGLGIEAVYISCLLLVLILLLISPLLYNYHALKGLSFLLLCASLFFFGKAHINAEFNSTHPRPSSLVYCQDLDANHSYWASYDNQLSSWNAPYFAIEDETKPQVNFESKYASRFNHVASAEMISMQPSYFEVQETNTTASKRSFKLYLKPQRPLNRYEVFFDKPILFTDVKVNDKSLDIDLESEFSVRNSRFFNYHVANQEALSIEFTVHTTDAFELKIYESTYDLIQHPELKIKKRPDNQMAMPFVLNDATIVSYTIPFL